MKFKFIIYTSSFSENSWWVIALHYLCHLLNEKWQEAYIKRFIYPPKLETKSLIRFVRTFWYFLIYFYKKYFEKFKTYRFFNTPIINKIKNIDDYIVIYPEIIKWNPLNAKNVVRWFLMKPNGIDYWNNELYFYYQEAFNDHLVNKDLSNKLRNIYHFTDIYKQTNFWKRSWKCYIVRKWWNRIKKEDINDGIVIDWKSHSEIAKIFNTCEYCISYDLYTFYSYYATLCGCKSIVIPEEWVSKEKWQPEEKLRYWICYWFQEIDKYNIHDEKEKINLLINEEKIETEKSIDNFLKKCFKHFQ